jgi:DNA-binding response OmpR family regulator
VSGEAPSLLVVDHDEHFSAALAAEARSAGLQVFSCRHWWEAKPLLDSAARLDGMIVELVLPEGTPNGLSVALMARNRRGPRLPVVFTSNQPELLKEIRKGTGPALAKTVGVERLVRCAIDLIEARNRKSDGAIADVSSSPRLSLTPVAKYRLDRATCFRSVNDSALILWRKNRTELLGRQLLDVFPQLDGLPKFRAHLEVLAGGGVFAERLASVILHDQIDIQIVRDRAGLRVSFALAA